MLLDHNSLYAALYLVGFAALHSFLASRPPKRIAQIYFGNRVDPWYTVLFSMIAIITILPLVALLIRYPGQMLYTVAKPWNWLMLSMQLFIGVATLRAFYDAPHRFMVRPQLARPQSPEAFALGIRGIYCWMRDPFLPSGLLLMWLTPFMTVNLLVVYIMASVYLFLGSLHWERRLFAQFGEDYAAYKEEVPRMIPLKIKWKGCANAKKGQREITEKKN